jgi:protease-4
MKKFFQQILASFLGSLAGLFFFFALSTGGLIIFLLILLFSESIPQIDNQSALVFNLDSYIKDNHSDTELENLLSEGTQEKLTVRQITEAINKGAKDPRIVALFLDGSQGNLNLGFASLTEIKTALDNFKSQGKKIFAYNVSAGEKDYFLTSMADEASLNPMGLMEMNGFAASQLFFANSFEKYGIGVQVLRVGQFKSAVEPFTRNNYSQENRQQTAELLTDIWNFYLTEIAKNRNLTKEKINNIANNQGILKSEEAHKLNLIDQVAYLDNVTTQLKEVTNSQNEDSFRKIDITSYLQATKSKSQTKDKVAILYIEGLIVDGKGRIGEVGSERFIEQIQKIRQNKEIKGVVVRINSPGGSALASELILRELQLTAQAKPIIVSMGDFAASGGYWIATVGEKIFASKTTITGSIGVFGLLFNLEKISQNNGISNDVVKTNELADIDNSFKAKSPAELAILQSTVEQIYNSFLEKVAQARSLPKEKVAEIAQGKIWSGEDAQQIGLVDEVGGLDSALQYLSAKLDLSADYQVEEYPEKRSLEVELLKKFSEAKISHELNNSTHLAQLIWQLNSDLALKEIFHNPRQIYTILPFKLNIE